MTMAPPVAPVLPLILTHSVTSPVAARPPTQPPMR